MELFCLSLSWFPPILNVGTENLGSDWTAYNACKYITTKALKQV